MTGFHRNRYADPVQAQTRTNGGKIMNVKQNSRIHAHGCMISGPGNAFSPRPRPRLVRPRNRRNSLRHNAGSKGPGIFSPTIAIGVFKRAISLLWDTIGRSMHRAWTTNRPMIATTRNSRANNAQGIANTTTRPIREAKKVTSIPGRADRPVNRPTDRPVNRRPTRRSPPCLAIASSSWRPAGAGPSWTARVGLAGGWSCYPTAWRLNRVARPWWSWNGAE